MRFAIAAGTIFVLYVALDMLMFESMDWLGRAGVNAGNVGATMPNAVPRDRAAESSRGLTPRHQVAAWRLGQRYAVATQIASFAGMAGRPQDLAKAESVLAQGQAEAALLGLDRIEPLHAATALQVGRVPQRIEADEGGVAARVQAATTLRHRHIFLAGAYAGLLGYTRATAPDMDATVGAPEFERHARLAGLPEPMWRALLRPAGDTGPQRAAAARAAEQRLDALLASDDPAPAPVPAAER